MTKKAWLTYAWDDDTTGDVEFVAQVLSGQGVAVHLDRWDLSAGRRLWTQIGEAITREDRTDAWILYATQASLASEPCQEELAYALDRALRTRGDTFPLIGLFPSRVDPDLIPPAIRIRLYVSLTDPDWAERVVGAVQGRLPSVAHRQLEPYEVVLHSIPIGSSTKPCLELRPRAGSWNPCAVAIPLAERERVNPDLMPGPRSQPPRATIVHNRGQGVTDDGQFWAVWMGNEVTPTQSAFLLCDALPSRVRFGSLGSLSAHEVTLSTAPPRSP